MNASAYRKNNIMNATKLAISVRDMVRENPMKLYSYVKGKRMDGSGMYTLKADGVAHNDPIKKA
ncbi:hypothetical protein DPMN_062740 [Dreissena polymorpha]|uniref:Uncharacterized protein n=1 Tax=Dreissena polymorpha TaxID=45954 RepID=A0A9D4HKF5_DREPO|nr:hypothetical protein DPMN_062740 [Dreissena polymorpha]